MIGTKETRTTITLENLGDMWNCSRLHKVVLLVSLYLSISHCIRRPWHIWQRSRRDNENRNKESKNC